jgi:2,3-dimethylmalate lyase
MTSADNALKHRLAQPEILVAPGAYDSLIARLIELSGFEAVYMSGAGVAYSTFGTPDVGITTATQMIERLEAIADSTSLPVIADGDTGYGNAINLLQTVKKYERAGACAIQLEDQNFPKRCGHLAGKELVPAAEMVGKIKAAVDARTSENFLIIARTDARAVHGIGAAIDYGHMYIEAGADVLFVESPTSEAELQAVADAFPDTPLMANMVEGGKTPLLSAAQLQAMGYSLVIFPNSVTRHFVHTGLAFLQSLREHGTTAPQLDKMMDFRDLNDLLGIERFHDLERTYLPPKEETMTS